MGSSEERIVAVIMVGGPTKCTSFRPLSLNIPKPLFPLAGKPMVNHPISACKQIPNLAQVYLIGFYEEREFALFVSSTSNELKVPIRYSREDKPHGSAGGLHNFRDLILEDNPMPTKDTGGLEQYWLSRFLLSQLASLGNLWLILILMSCCITLRNLKLLFVKILKFN